MVGNRFALTQLDAELMEYTFNQTADRSPYALYERLRARGPCHRSALGMHLVVSYGLALKILRDPAFSSDVSRWELYADLATHGGQEVFFWKAAKRQLLLLDPPDHTRIRRLMSDFFTYRAVSSLGAAIARVADEELAQLETAEEVEFMAQVARRIPVRVVADLMGVPPDEVEHFDRLARALSTSLDPLQMYLSEQVTQTTDGAAVAFANYVADLTRRKRAAPVDDLISHLAGARDAAGQLLDDEELGAGCALLLIAGLDTSTNVLGSALSLMLGTPGFSARRISSHEQWAALIEEVVRLESPVQATARVASAGVEVQGQRFFAGDLVLVVNGAANRDPAEFADAGSFVPERSPNAHIGFGYGRHVCLGAALARRQLATVLPRLMTLLDAFTLDAEALKWRASFSFRGPDRLVLRRRSQT